MRRVILYFALKYEGNYMLIHQAIKNKEVVDPKELDEIEKRIKCNYITIIDKEYPNCLKSIVTPPFVLFYYGDISLLAKENKLAMIGTRKNTCYGEEMTRKIVKESEQYNPIIVSGLAKGIDCIAHKQALSSNIVTIAVLGSGIDNCYPKENKEVYENIKKNGLIISEYPNDLIPKPQNFLIRNRIIAAISDYIIVVEANLKSGTMNTVAYGLEFGKEICCVPNLANVKSGCNYLIKQGALLIESAHDIYQ